MVKYIKNVGNNMNNYIFRDNKMSLEFYLDKLDKIDNNIKNANSRLDKLIYIYNHRNNIIKSIE